MSDPDTSEYDGTKQLHRALNLWDAVALGVGGTIGGGIFVLVGEAAGLAGPGVLLAFVFAFLAAMTIALPYAELAPRFPKAGGGYAFVRAVLGRAWGFVMGWGYWGAYVFISGYVTLGFGGYFQALTGFPKVVGAMVLIAAITVINLTGIKMSGRTQMMIVLLTLLSLTGFGLLGLPHTNPGNLSPFLPQGLTGVFQAALLAFLAFGGFDMVAAAGEEIDHPSRNLPLAILLTLAIVLGIYLLVTYVAVSLLPWQTLDSSPAPLADAVALFLGPTGAWLVSGAALLTTAATSNAVLVTISRVSFAMARDGLLPERLSSVHPTSGAPHIAVLVSAALLGIVALAGSIQLAARIGGFLYVSQFVLALVSLAFLRIRGEKISRAFQTPIPFLTLPLAFGGCLILILSSGLVGLLGSLSWLLIGLLFYQRNNLLRFAGRAYRQTGV